MTLLLITGAVVLLGFVTAGVRRLRRGIAIVDVTGLSMQPALTAGDRVLIRRSDGGGLRPGQIVVIEKPAQDGRWGTTPLPWPPGRREWMIKRIAAVAGDLRPLSLPADAADPAESVVPAGKLVVLGDNPARSLDSRQIGYVPEGRVLGVVLRRLN